MQEEYQKKLEQEVWQYISNSRNKQGTDPLPAVQEVEDKITRQR